jgi:hypothetical protein
MVGDQDSSNTEARCLRARDESVTSFGLVAATVSRVATCSSEALKSRFVKIEWLQSNPQMTGCNQIRTCRRSVISKGEVGL